MISRALRWLELRPGEGKSVALAAAMFFCVLSSYNVLRPVREALVLDGDPAFIPWLFTATMVLTLAVAGPWGAMASRWPRARLVPRVYRLFELQLLGFAALLAAPLSPVVVGKVFYVWVSMFNLFVVSVFWSVCADVTRPEQGRRLFAPISIGGTLGAIFGPALTRALAEHLPTEGLLVVSAALVELACFFARRLDAAVGSLAARPGHEQAPPAGALGGSAWAGFGRLARSPALLGIAGYVLLAASLGTFVYLRQAEIVKAALPDRTARTEFFAEIDLWTQLGTIALQLAVTGRLLRWLGPGVVLAVLPLVQGAGAIVFAVAPSLTVAAAVSATSRAATHGLSRPARELLFTAVPRQDKYKAKNLIDTFVFRVGDFASAWLVRGLSIVGVPVLAVAVPLAAGWLALALALGVGHQRRVGKAGP